MRQTSLGATGLPVSVIGFGGAPFGFLATDAATARRLLNDLLDAGIRLIDTAACYDESEAGIGQEISNRRDEDVSVSKCDHQVDGLTGTEFSAPLITATVDRALRRLRTGRLDVMLLHPCSMADLIGGDAIGALVTAKRNGKVRFIGYSGDNEEVVAAARMTDVDVIETSFNALSGRLA